MDETFITNIVLESGTLVKFALSCLLLCLLIWHVVQAFRKRQWLITSHSRSLLALNAGILALLGLLAKPAEPWETDEYSYYDIMLIFTVFIASMIGALMPSVAVSRDLKEMWSNVAGVSLFVATTELYVFLWFFYPDYSAPTDSSGPNIISLKPATECKVVLVCLLLLSMLLLMQALAAKPMMSDVGNTVSQRLEQVCMNMRPGHGELGITEERTWSWKEVEQRSHIKLMMVLTSSPQNVMTRSPYMTIVGVLVLFCGVILSHRFRKFSGLVQFNYAPLFLAVLVCNLICVWRGMWLALQEDRPFLTLISAAEPSFWCRSLNSFQWKLKARPHHSTQKGRWRWRWPRCLQKILLITAAFLLQYVIVPAQRMLVSLTWFVHILSALLVQKLIRRPMRALGARRIFASGKHRSGPDFDLGVICLEGEDVRIVGEEFAGAAIWIIQQSEKAKEKFDFRALISLLESFRLGPIFAAGQGYGISDVLHQDGAPFLEKPHVKHGHQFGWSLTAIWLVALLAQIEVTVLGESAVAEVTVNALRQAMNMMLLVDEQFVSCSVCSTGTYATACTFALSKLLQQKRGQVEALLFLTFLREL